MVVLARGDNLGLRHAVYIYIYIYIYVYINIAEHAGVLGLSRAGGATFGFVRGKSPCTPSCGGPIRTPVPLKVTYRTFLLGSARALGR